MILKVLMIIFFNLVRYVFIKKGMMKQFLHSSSPGGTVRRGGGLFHHMILELHSYLFFILFLFFFLYLNCGSLRTVFNEFYIPFFFNLIKKTKIILKFIIFKFLEISYFPCKNTPGRSKMDQNNYQVRGFH